MNKQHRQTPIHAWMWAPSLVPVLMVAAAWLAGDGITQQARQLLGAAIFATQAVALGWTAYRVAYRCVGAGGPVDIVLGSTVVFLSIPACIVAILGAVGLLTLPVVVAATSVVQMALIARFGRAGERLGAASGRLEQAWRPLSAGEWFLVSLCVVPYAILILNFVRYTEIGADELTYYLPLVAEWIRNRSTIPGPEILMAHRGYPAAREAMLAWLTLPLRSENLALLSLVELPLAWFAVYGLCRAFTVPRPLSLAIAGAFVTSPVVAGNALNQKNDVFVALTFSLASFFLLRALRTQRATDVVLAGLAGGLTAGAKFTGPAYVALLLATFVAVGVTCALRKPEPGHRDVATTLWLAAIAAGVAATVAAPWYLRNLIYLGNPLYPAHVSFMGHTLFEGPFDTSLIQNTIVGLNVSRLFPYWREFVQAFGFTFPALVVAPIVLVLLWLLQRGRGSFPELLWMICLPSALFVLYLFQPFGLRASDATSFLSFQPRYLMVWAIALQVTVGAVLSRPGALANAGAALAAAAAIGNVAVWTRYWWLAVLFAGAASLTAATASQWTMAIVQRLRPSARALAAVVILGTGTAGLAWIDAFRETQKGDEDYGYPREKPRGHLSAYVRQHISHSTLLCLGSSITFPLYGPRFTNRLVYLEHRDDEDQRMRFAGYRYANEYIPESFDVMQFIAQKKIDYVVGYVPIVDRRGANGEEYFFGPAPTVALRERYPGRFQLIYSHDGEEVLKVLKSP